MLIYDDSKIEGIFNSYLINFRFDTKYSKYELELKDIKKVLQDLSILLCYDLEPCHEIICAKFSNIRGISYPFFKECLYNFLDKKEVRLNTMFLVEQNSVPLENVKTIGNNDFNKKNYEESDNIEEIKYTDDLNLIILHRSLYILKKKFEKYKPQFKDIYNKYSEKIFELEGNKDEILENEILVEIKQIPKILIELLNTGKFELSTLKNFKDAIFKEMKYTNNNINIEDNIMKEFNDYITKNRRKYNYIFKQKKINKNFQLESYLDYIPQGDDELTKIVIETVGDNNEKKNKNIKDDTRSEIVPNKFKVHDLNKEDLISEISNNKNIIKEENENDYNGEILEEKKNENEQNNEEKEQEEMEDQNNKNKLINKNKIRKNSFYSEIENKKTIKYSKYYIYIESLPLIIADFISNQNKSYIILDHGDELRNDLRTLFDNEILSRLGEEISYEINRNKMEQLKELLLNKAKVEKNISCYEDLLYQMRTHNQNVQFVLITLNKLKDSLNWIEKKISVIQDDTNTFNEYENNLKIKKLDEEIINNKKMKMNDKENSKNTNLKKKNNIKNIKNNNDEINNENIKENINENFNQDNNNIISEKINNINDISFDTKNQNDTNNEILGIIESKKQTQNNSRRLSEISILKLDEHIEGIDTARLIDSNLINNENPIFRSKKNKNVENSNNKNNLNFFNQYNIQKNKLPKIKNKNDLSKEEKRELNIKEIFNFYSHQHSNAGHKTTFDSIRDKFEHLNMSEFGKFCSEFKILIPKEKLLEIFKKTSSLVKEMSFQEFKVALSKISFAINEEKVNQLKKRIKHFKNSLNYNNRNITIENLKKEQVDELVQKCKDEIKQLNKKSNEELLEEFYQYLEIDDEEKYHLKMKGFVLPIFQGGNVLHTTAGEQTNKNIPVKVKLENIKDMIEKRKEQKKSIEKNVIRVNGLNREYQKKKLDKINNNNSNKNIFMNKSLLGYNKKNKLEPIKQTNSNYSDTNINSISKRKIINDILNIKNNDNELVYENNLSDNVKIFDRYEMNMWNNNIKNYNKKNTELNSFPRKLNDLINDQEAEKEVSDQLNFKPNNILGNNMDINPLLLKNKNIQNVKQNKYTWDTLQKMKSNSLVDETELNNLIK